jgi:protein subunit release factor B
MSPEKVSAEELRASYRLPPDDEDLLAECDLTVFKSSGPGGQHRNKTMSSVRLHHEPSGLVVIGRRERSQKRNLDDALSRLRIKLEKLLEKPKTRKKSRPSTASKEKRLEEKKRHSRLKRERGSREWD